MNMTIAYMLFLFTTAIVISFFIRFKIISQNILFFLLYLTVFLYEGTLLITTYLKIPNHIVANIYTMIYYPLAIFVLFKVWESIKGKSSTLSATKWVIVGLILIGWLLENFVIHDIGFYNSKLASIISMLLVIVSVYLINVMLFFKNNSIIKDSHGLFLIGILIRSFSGGLLLLFMNYRMGNSLDFYKNVLILVNLALIISNIFFLFSIICLPKKRKYTWPF